MADVTNCALISYSNIINTNHLKDLEQYLVSFIYIKDDKVKLARYGSVNPVNINDLKSVPEELRSEEIRHLPKRGGANFY